MSPLSVMRFLIKKPIVAGSFFTAFCADSSFGKVKPYDGIVHYVCNRIDERLSVTRMPRVLIALNLTLPSSWQINILKFSTHPNLHANSRLVAAIVINRNTEQKDCD